MNPLPHTEASSDLPQGRLSAGQMLRAAREAQGLHLAMLSVNLKVSVRQLEALEADQHEAFKGATFVRALAQSVCRQLKIDPAPVLAALPQAVAPKALEPVSLASRQAAAQPAQRATTSSGSGKGLSRQVLLLAVLMLVGAAALIWWPQQSKDTLAEEALDPAQAAVPMGQASDLQEASAPASAELPASAPVAVAASAPPALPVAAPAPVVPVAAAAPAVRAQASAPSAPASGAATGASTPDAAPLVLRLTADAWVEVRDNRGQMAIKRMVKAGETLRLEAGAPVFVYVGRADSAELSWQGKLVDLKPHTTNNEARLQLKP